MPLEGAHVLPLGVPRSQALRESLVRRPALHRAAFARAASATKRDQASADSRSEHDHYGNDNDHVTPRVSGGTETGTEPGTVLRFAADTHCRLPSVGWEGRFRFGTLPYVRAVRQNRRPEQPTGHPSPRS